MAAEDSPSLISGFDTLKKAVIDTSSIVYMNKAGFFETVCRTLDLITHPEVLRELENPGTKEPWVQNVAASITLQDLPAHIDPLSGRADGRLLALASHLHIPLISEDGKLLMKCDRAGVPYYNSLMILLYLFYRGVIDDSKYDRFKRLLLPHARYSQRVLAYEKAAFIEVMKYR